MHFDLRFSMCNAVHRMERTFTILFLYYRSCQEFNKLRNVLLSVPQEGYSETQPILYNQHTIATC